MQSKKTLALFLLCQALTGLVSAQSAVINPRWQHGYWTARWIADPGSTGNEFGVYHLRKSFTLPDKPASFVVHVSADNRYRLYVNGRSVSTGPARSDLANWNFETVDIASFLQKGDNVVAATVWNFATYRPYAQISFQTAFILQGDGAPESVINSNASWKIIRDSSYQPLPIDKEKMHTYIVTADGERLDGNHYPWGYEQPGYDDSRWAQASVLWYPAKTRTFGTDGNWMLVPRAIPLPEETPQRFAAIRRGNIPGMDMRDYKAFLSGKSPLQIPAHSHVTLLLDQSVLTNAYPVLRTSGGRNALLRLSYAEAMVNDQGVKGNRDSVAGKKLLGIADEYMSDGGQDRLYSPLFFRTFRYLQLDIETKNEPLILRDFYSLFTGYPFRESAYFKSDREDLQKIWQTGWRTARLCAVETYFDCPYYEQLQYVGDTRIQSLISLYVSGDARLMKKAIGDISHSFISEGLTQSRYPCRDMQVIPTFSLWWICMIHDYWMHREDDAFVSSQLDGIERVLQWYKEKIADNGMLGSLSWWQFVDWSWPWVDSIRVGGVPPGASAGGSSIITLEYVYALQRAAQLMAQFGRNEQSGKYQRLADSLARATYRLCWNEEKGLLADSYLQKEYSQHANIMAVLTDAIPLGKQQALMNKIIGNKEITPCTYYFTFYLFEALKKVKLGDRFLGLLKPWYDMLDVGLTTFAENPEPTRSDCHAWSASPNYELLSLICGIKPASPGFRQVSIEPYLGNLTRVEGLVPHPNGDVKVNFTQTAAGLHASIELPPGLSGVFRWKGKEVALKPGKQEVDLESGHGSR